MAFDALPGLDPASIPEGWLERLEAASFRGVPFFTMAEEFSFGRRLDVNEYPSREKPNVEDVGRRADRFRIEAFVVGADYDLQRNRLIDALRESGAGELRTQRFGTHSVNIDTGRVREDGVEGRWSKITFDAVESGVNLEPRDSAATRSIVESLLGEAAAGVLTEFVLDAEVGVGWVQEALESDVAEAMNDAVDFSIEVQKKGPLAMGVELATRSIKNQTTSSQGSAGLGKDLASLGSDMIDVYLDLGATESTTTAKLRHLEELRHVGEDASGTLHGSDPGRHVDAVLPADLGIATANREAMSALVRQAITIGRVNAGIEVPLVSLEQTRTVRDDVLGPLDEEIDVAATDQKDDAYVRMRELRDAVAQDFAVRGEQLPELVSYTPPLSTSSFLLAQRLYGDGGRESEIVERVDPPHPGFIVGGRELRVVRP